MTEYRLHLISTVAAVLGGITALLGGYYWYRDYVQRATLEASAALHKARLDACVEVTESGARLFSASSPDEFQSLLNRFAELKHGKALALLDSKVVSAMLSTYNSGLVVDKQATAATYPNKVRCALGDRVFGIAYACRAMIKDDYRREGGSAITDLDEQLKMSWKNWAHNSCI